jgi:hypothetical protein
MAKSFPVAFHPGILVGIDMDPSGLFQVDKTQSAKVSRQ